MTKPKLQLIYLNIHTLKVGIWIFDCSSAHEGLAPDTLNVNNMNINPGGISAKVMHPTIVSLNNPPPKPGQCDMQGDPQDMVYPTSHPDEKL
jgi:hypothetical protein